MFLFVYLKGRKLSRKKYLREEIFVNLPLIRENKLFTKIYQNSSIRENLFHKINQNSIREFTISSKQIEMRYIKEGSLEFKKKKIFVILSKG